LALSAVLGIAVSACSAPGSTGLAVPQNAASKSISALARARSVVAQGVRRGMARIEKAQKAHAPARAGKKSHDYQHPSNVTTANPPVPRPNETPCTVTLFSNFQFTNFTYPTFSYAPPAACPGPWAKVVFEGDFAVTPGIQFDRTGSIWIAGTNIYFGTTAEPSPNLGPSWHVERDVTDLSAIFQAPSTGEVVLGNIVNSTYTGVISASGRLLFYPANAANPAPVVADDVYPLSGGPLGDNQYITTQAQPLTGTFTLPRNVEAAYLDVYLQSQIGDEFWYTCFPNDIAAEFNNCGNTAFREGDVAIDGRPAGVAPVYPWIFTGGIDPFLWTPIPGVETLEFSPYRVNLTPFAALLDDGNPHTITVNVFNNGNYFAANGALLVFLDHGSSQVTGGLVGDATSLYPSPSVKENLTTNAQGVTTGTVSVTSTHPVSIDGYVNTSQGRIETKVQQTVSFSNVQTVEIGPTVYDQSIVQGTSVASSTMTQHRGAGTQWTYEQKAWPLGLVYDFTVNNDGSASQYASVSQRKEEQSVAHAAGSGKPATAYLTNVVNSSDTLTFPASGGFFPSGGKSSQTYAAGNSATGYCYAKTVASSNYNVTVNSGGFCNGSKMR
jgi:hypothetical protein